MVGVGKEWAGAEAAIWAPLVCQSQRVVVFVLGGEAAGYHPATCGNPPDPASNDFQRKR